MPTVTATEMRNALKDAGLENAGAGVVFPWGVRIVEVDGRKMLQPMTPAEFAEAVRKDTGKELTEAEVMSPSCVYTTANCVSQGCAQVGGSCSMHYGGGGWYCLCNY